MKKTKILVKVTSVATIALLGGMAHRAQGQAYIYSLAETQSTTVSTWGAGTLTYQTGAGPETDSGGTTQDNDSWGGNANGANGYGALAQAFTVTQSGVLSTAQLVMAGGTQAFSVELYDLGPTPAGYQAASGNTPTVTQINGLGNPVTASSGSTLNGGVNLLATTGFTFTSPASQDLVTLNFGAAGNSPVNLVTGELYALSLDPVGGTADNTWWDRGALPSASYNTGEGLNADGVDGMQDFEGKSSVRDFDLAITETATAVPEPSTMALLGLGSLAWSFRRRFGK